MAEEVEANEPPLLAAKHRPVSAIKLVVVQIKGFEVVKIGPVQHLALLNLPRGPKHALALDLIVPSDSHSPIGPLKLLRGDEFKWLRQSSLLTPALNLWIDPKLERLLKDSLSRFFVDQALSWTTAIHSQTFAERALPFKASRTETFPYAGSCWVMQ